MKWHLVVMFYQLLVFLICTHAGPGDQHSETFGGVYSPYDSPSDTARVKELIENHPDVQNCVPVQTNILARHGTRRMKPIEYIYLGKDLEKIESHDDDRSDSFKTEFDLLKKNNSREDARFLHEKGRREMLGLGERLREYWPQLSKKGLKSVEIVAIPMASTIDSAYWIVHGLKDLQTKSSYRVRDMENLVYDNIHRRALILKSEVKRFQTGTENDHELNSFRSCSRFAQYSSEVNEQEQFESRPDYLKLLQSVREEFVQHFPPIWLNDEEYHSLLNLCFYDILLRNNSTLCDLISSELRKAEEFNGDLRSFWKFSSDATKFNHSCILSSNIVNDFDKRIRSKSSPFDTKTAHVIRVTGWETVLSLISSLNLFKFSPLRANDNFLAKHAYHTGKLVPLGANIVFTLYNCEQGKTNSQNEEDNFKVMVLVNEEIVLVEPWRKMKKRFTTCSLEQYNEWCSN